MGIIYLTSGQFASREVDRYLLRRRVWWCARRRLRGRLHDVVNDMLRRRWDRCQFGQPGTVSERDRFTLLLCHAVLLWLLVGCGGRRDGRRGWLHDVVNNVLRRGWYLRGLRKSETFLHRFGKSVDDFRLGFVWHDFCFRSCRGDFLTPSLGRLGRSTFCVAWPSSAVSQLIQ